MSQIHFCTWSNSLKNKRLALLKASAKKFKVDFEILECHSILEKQTSLQKYLYELKDDSILCCTDGFDVLYTGDKNQIIEKFNSLNTKLLFSGEALCSHHLPEVKSALAERGSNEEYPFLCAGLIIGYVSEYKIMMKEISKWDLDLLKKKV